MDNCHCHQEDDLGEYVSCRHQTRDAHEANNENLAG